MSGTAHVCDKDLLQPGMPCIIQVDCVNSPTGLWWGEVTATETRENYLSIAAKITGGRFQLNDWKPVKSDEEKNRTPSLNYRVYPDNETTRMLFEFVHRAEAETAEANTRAVHWHRTHLDVIANTMAHLLREGLVVDKKKEGGKS